MPTFVQWVHVTAAVIGVGGIGFLAFILLPSAGILNADQRDLLMRVVQRRFRWVTWTVIVLLIVSGLYNAGLAWDVPWGTYWKFLTLKIVLAFAVFTIALSLTLPLKSLERFRAKRRTWLSVAFAIAMIVILISAYLRRP
jgi:putative copper resistance protein D